MLIKEKIEQAVTLLEELEMDCWLTFARETGIARDPALNFLIDSNVTWHSAFIVTRSGETHAIVGQMDRQSVEDLGVYGQITSYVQGVKEQLQAAFKELDPKTIAINYSRNSEVCDGLTHGMYLTLHDYLAEIGFEQRLVSSEKLVSSLRARKTATELRRIRTAIQHTLEIFGLVGSFLSPGRTEKEVAQYMLQEVHRRGLQLAWDAAHCPAVFTGPETAEAHYRPTARRIERGHILNMDFGVKVEGYCSDLQRTFFILDEGAREAPEEVRHGFQTILESIELARKAIRPGARGLDVDAVARQHIVSRGYEEFPHGLGHQVGRFAHDGTALLGPAWEKYSEKPFLPLEQGMVFTLEPRLRVAERGIVTVEEMVVVTEDGADYLGPPQKELILIS